MASGRASGRKILASTNQNERQQQRNHAASPVARRNKRRKPLASIRSKRTTVVWTHPSTSRTFGKRAGDRNLRIGTVNVGSINERSGEVADMAARRRLGSSQVKYDGIF